METERDIFVLPFLGCLEISLFEASLVFYIYWLLPFIGISLYDLPWLIGISLLLPFLCRLDVSLYYPS